MYQLKLFDLKQSVKTLKTYIFTHINVLFKTQKDYDFNL